MTNLGQGARRICSIFSALAVGALLAACGADAALTEPREQSGSPIAPRPESGEIAYWGPGAGGSMINVLNLRTEGLLVLEATRQSTSGNSRAGGRISWSPDGSSIAFEGRTECADPQPYCWYYEVFEINADGTGLRKLSTALPVWSPDGARIAFEEGGMIHVTNTDGSGRVQLTTRDDTWSGPGDTWPAWSADGTEIVFERSQWRCVGFPERGPADDCGGEAGGVWESIEGIFSVYADGTGERKIVGQVCDVVSGRAARLGRGGWCYTPWAPAWSPDGSAIALGSGGGVWLVARNGSGSARLTGSPGGSHDYAYAPAWSRDGAWIAFSGAVVHSCEDYGSVTACHVSTKVFVTKADGSSAAARLKDDGTWGDDMYPVWRPE